MKQDTIEPQENPEISKLKKELNSLEDELSKLTVEKADLEKIIQEYNTKYFTSVGHLIDEVAKLRIEKMRIEAKTDFSKIEEVEKAQREYTEFKQTFEDVKSKEVTDISKEEELLLKKSFLKASKLCHPDRVAEEFEKEAAKIFNDLKEAYGRNDISKVEEILNFLKNNEFPTKSQKVTNEDRLRLLISKIKFEIKKLKVEIAAIKDSEIYKHITTIGDWKTYFTHIKKQLEKEAEALKIFLAEN